MNPGHRVAFPGTQLPTNPYQTIPSANLLVQLDFKITFSKGHFADSREDFFSSNIAGDGA